jgi:hypothetical protein
MSQTDRPEDIPPEMTVLGQAIVAKHQLSTQVVAARAVLSSLLAIIARDERQWDGLLRQAGDAAVARVRATQFEGDTDGCFRDTVTLAVCEFVIAARWRLLVGNSCPSGI